MSTTENQIQADIDALKSQFTNTQALYREVAAVLFFRYGLTPTANKLYQLVRKGSMSAPAEALNRFWAELRDKSRVRIEAPDIPEEVVQQAGNLTSTLWNLAQSHAHASTEQLRSHIEAQLLTLRTERDDALSAAATTRKSVDDQNQTIRDMEQKLAAELAKNLALKTRLDASDGERERLQLALKGARDSFSQELDKVQETIRAIEARAEAEIKRYLLEIDRERGLAKKANLELNTAKARMAKELAASKTEHAKLQKQVSHLIESSGKLQGKLAELSSQYTQTKKDLASANSKLIKSRASIPRGKKPKTS